MNLLMHLIKTSTNSDKSLHLIHYTIMKETLKKNKGERLYT